MSDGELTDLQRSALAPDIRLIEACPGAGKTRTIVERFRQNALASDHGVALLSFTNAAIDEVVARCSSSPEILKAPHFVGTFDTFLHRYIVTPYEIAAGNGMPQYLQSWDELPGNASTLQIGQRVFQRIRLSHFSVGQTGQFELRAESLTGKERVSFNGATQGQKDSFIASARQRLGRHTAAGRFDSDSARYRALEILRLDEAAGLRDAIKLRFEEVIVDEFQDCAAIEHELLDALAALGVRITVVADPDQSIFGFRYPEDVPYSDYRSRIDTSSIVPLNTSFRSAQAICAFVSSLRFYGGTAITAGRTPDPALDAPHVYVLAGEDGPVRARFLALATEFNVPVGERYALAHSRNDARALSSIAARLDAGDNTVSKLFEILAVLKGNASPIQRKRACDDLAKLVMAQLSWGAGEDMLPTARKLELIERDAVWVRAVAGALLAAAPSWNDISAAGAGVRAVLESHLTEQTRPFKGSFANTFTKPKDAAWAHWLSAIGQTTSPGELSWSTIHGAKGKEFDAVLLKAPAKRVFDEWKTGAESEERRLFYVGASRARRLLVIAVAKSRLAEMRAHFSDMGIPVVVEAAVA